ncbi:MAG: SiaB family protein kinase [Bacteroidales bacterium]|nr:SiaB family protein kinase [Bacteroidales bacterium]
MAQESGQNLFEIAYPLFQRIHDNDFEYVYRGFFDHSITKKILFLADTNIAKVTNQSQATLQKRIYYIMVEGLQNITHHQEEIANDKDFDKFPGIFAIQKNGARYYISTGNIVANDKIESLKSKLDVINSLTPDELKKFHREILSNGNISDKGGAGLGLIEMSRKSGNKLLYSFEKLDDEFTYFYLQTLIPTDASYGTPDGNSHHSSLESVKALHRQMNTDNILLYFNGFFNQENLLSLLAIIKSRMNSMPLTTIKISNVMVEMLQNIIKHGHKSDKNGGAGISGVFFLGQMGNETILTSGNIIQDSAKAIITERLEFVNGMTKDELSDYYDDILLDFDTADAKKTGLGFSDLRIKSDRPLKYKFLPVNDNEQFYLLQTSVKTKK